MMRGSSFRQEKLCLLVTKLYDQQSEASVVVRCSFPTNNMDTVAQIDFPTVLRTVAHFKTKSLKRS